jgi:potassium channel subfamily K
LLFNFTGRIRYIIALPATIVLWYGATFLVCIEFAPMSSFIKRLTSQQLLADTVSLHIYSPPIGPNQIYSQGFWYAVISIVLYFVSSSILLINMLGYFLGHYPQRFELNDHQRTLILQTMLFFIWLAGGGAMFSKVENLDNGGAANWAFVDGVRTQSKRLLM